MTGVLTKKNRMLAAAVFSVLTLLALWGMLAHVIPFRPFMLRDYDAVPPRGCPGIPLELTIHYDLIDPSYLEIEDYQLRTNWVKVATGSDTPLEPFEGDFSQFKRGRDLRMVSPHYRIAPPLEGAWQIYTEMVIRGRVLGWPREQILPGRVYDNVFRALPPGTEDCA